MASRNSSEQAAGESASNLARVATPRGAAGCGATILWEDLHKKWRTWLETISNQVSWIMLDRTILRRIMEIVQDRYCADDAYDFARWCAYNYVESITIRLRRQVDTNTKSVSLVRLLTDIERQAARISRTWFISHYPDRLVQDGVADTDFNAWAKPGDTHADPGIATQHCRELSDAYEAVRVFANKRVAHHDRRADSKIPIPEWGELDRAIDVLEEKTIACKLLIEQAGPSTLEPPLPNEWEGVFAASRKPDQRLDRTQT